MSCSAPAGAAPRRQPAEPHDVRHLLAPRWLPYRHGLDFVSDLAAAATMQASDVAERRRAAKLAESGTPVRRADKDEDEDDLAEDTGFVVRFLTNPVAVVVTLFVIVALVGARDAFGAVSGGALSPPPGEAADWWRLHIDSWHAIGQGTPVPAPAYVLPLAVVASAPRREPGCGDECPAGPGRAALAVGRLAAAPRDRAPGGRGRLPHLAGRLGCAELLPGPGGQRSLGGGPVRRGRRRRRCCRGWPTPRSGSRTRIPTAGGGRPGARPCFFALGAAFAPMVFWIGVVLALVVVGAGFLISPSAMRDRSVWGPPAAAMASVPVLLAPWWLPAVIHGAGAGLFFDSGRVPMPVVGFPELLLGRLGDAGAPWWLGLVFVVLAALALIPRATRIPVLVCWVVALGTAVLAALLGLVDLRVPHGHHRSAGSASSWSCCRPCSSSPRSWARTAS